MKYTITTPLPNVTGIHAGVNFTNGTAMIDDGVKEDAAALYYFQSAGYGIAPVEEEKPKRRARQQEPAAPVRPADSASTEDWRAYALAAGMPEADANAKTRDELVALYPKEADK